MRVFDLEDLLGERFAAVVIVALVCVPAFVVARWQARKPPSRVMPP